MDALLLLIIAIWVVLNGYVAYKGFVYLRVLTQHAPDATNEDQVRWVRGKALPDDVPEPVRPALIELRRWRLAGRRYFFLAVAVILLMVIQRQLGA